MIWHYYSQKTMSSSFLWEWFDIIIFRKWCHHCSFENNFKYYSFRNNFKYHSFENDFNHHSFGNNFNHCSQRTSFSRNDFIIVQENNLIIIFKKWYHYCFQRMISLLFLKKMILNIISLKTISIIISLKIILSLFFSYYSLEMIL